MNISYAESKNPNEYKVLSSENKKLSISNVQDYLNKGDKLANSGDFEKAKESYDYSVAFLPCVIRSHGRKYSRIFVPKCFESLKF